MQSSTGSLVPAGAFPAVDGRENRLGVFVFLGGQGKRRWQGVSGSAICAVPDICGFPVIFGIRSIKSSELLGEWADPREIRWYLQQWSVVEPAGEFSTAALPEASTGLVLNFRSSTF